jgi:uncharacterized protein (TIGR02466 family)
MSESESILQLTASEGLFASPIWIFDVDPDIAPEMNASLRSSLERMMAPLPDIPKGDVWQSEQKLHRAPEFNEFIELVYQASASVVDALKLEPRELEITGCWANIHPRGSAHKAHSHANNFLGGVYYLKLPPGSGAISFHDPRPQSLRLMPRVTERNALNSSSATIPVEEGRMIIFPAWLVHSVPPNPAEDVRISVSFNLMFKNFTEVVSPPLWSGLPLKGVD